MKYGTHFRNTPQSEPIPGKSMVQNAAGGYVFEISKWQRLRRFLILGCEGGSYYESERKLTIESANCVFECLREDFRKTIDTIVDISDHGQAPKNDPAIFALALASKADNSAARAAAFQALPKVCRIGTHLFQFAEAREAIKGGWGRGMRKAIGKWYDRPDFITQAIKYQQRGGWSHRDLLRLSHPKVKDALPAQVFDAICRPENWAKVNHPLVEGWLKIQKAETAHKAAALVDTYGLQREMVPTKFLGEPAVWAALLPHLRMTALVRNLGNLSKVGLLTPLSETIKTVYPRLTNAREIIQSRLHPFQILLANKTYAQGHGMLGGGEWNVVPQIVEALDRAFHLAFTNVTPTNKRHLLAVDVSGSMSMGAGLRFMTAAEAAAAMALVTARVEPNYYIMGFAREFRDLGINATDSLSTVLDKTHDHTFGGTDTSVAINWALKSNIPVDIFVVYTDNETWAGNQHTCDTLEAYRKATGLPTKLAVVAFTATARSIADRKDLNSMDFVGMDASLPAALAAFTTE